MQVSRQWVIDFLHRFGYQQIADEALRDLPDPVDLDRVYEFGERRGIFRDEMIGRMGGSP